MNDTAVTFIALYWQSLPGVTETTQESGRVSSSLADIKMGTSVYEEEVAGNRQGQCKRNWKAVTLTQRFYKMRSLLCCMQNWYQNSFTADRNIL